MNRDALDPVEVEFVASRRQLRVLWADHHESHYDLAYLRGYCPCAHCQGHSGGWDYVQNDGPVLTAMHEVGNYALNLVYADGHRTGIYAFALLRQLCPCDACRELQGPGHPARRMPTPEISQRT